MHPDIPTGVFLNSALKVYLSDSGNSGWTERVVATGVDKQINYY